MGTIHCRIEENTARIVTAALHKCPGKSSLNVIMFFLCALSILYVLSIVSVLSQYFSLEVVAKCLPK